MDAEILKKRVTLINIYGPSSGDKTEFFDTISQHIEQMENRLVIVAGDWDVMLNMKVDANNHKSNVGRPRARREIFDLIEEYDLFDAWRDINPEKQRFSRRKFNTTKHGGLDYFLISSELMPEVVGARIGSSYRSEHSVVLLSLKTEAFKRDKPFLEIQ